MPKSKVSKNKLFREFSRLNQRYIKNNYLKDLKRVLASTREQHNIFEKELMFMLWAYDLEFWTLDHAAEEYGYSRGKIGLYTRS